MFDVREAVIEHGMQEYPREAVGIVRAGSYVPLENVHDDPANHFRLDAFPDGAQAVIHTHTRTDSRLGPLHVSAAPSQSDMQTQQAMGIPWAIQPMQQNGPAGRLEWFGDTCPTPTLVGREFLSGSRDCWCLVRDFFRLQWGINLLNLPRDDDWYRRTEDEFDLLGPYWIKKAGFEPIEFSEARPGDVVLGSIASRRNNHTGLLCSRGLVLHQIEGRRSCLEPINPWQRYIHSVVRHKDAGEWDGECLPEA